jgi:hypothetical protein
MPAYYASEQALRHTRRVGVALVSDTFFEGQISAQCVYAVFETAEHLHGCLGAMPVAVEFAMRSRCSWISCST